MKIRNVEELSDKLDEDFTWRIKELLDLRRAITSNTKNTNIYIRAGIALLSAHLEGFIRSASNYYVVFVSDQKVPLEKVTNNFITMKLKGKFKECGNTDKISVHKTLFDKLDELKGGYFSVKFTEDKRIIETKANPSSSLIEEILCCLGLNFSSFETKKNYIDASLLKNRHDIVHGEKTYLGKDDFIETFEQITDIIEVYKSLILKAAEEKQYLKAN